MCAKQKRCREPPTYRGLIVSKKRSVIATLLLPRAPPQSCLGTRDQESVAVCGPNPTGLSELSPVRSSPWPVPFRKGPRTGWSGRGGQIPRATEVPPWSPRKPLCGCEARGKACQHLVEAPLSVGPGMARLQEIQGRKALGKGAGRLAPICVASVGQAGGGS